MAVDGRNKGNKFENEIAYAISDWVVPCPNADSWRQLQVQHLPFRRRPAQCDDVATDWTGQRDLLHRPDVEFPFSIECKKIEGWTFDGLVGDNPGWMVWEWWAQTVRQARAALLYPLLVFSRNNRPPYVMISEVVLLWAKPHMPPTAPIVLAHAPDGPVAVMDLETLVRVPRSELSRLPLPQSSLGVRLRSKVAPTASRPGSSKTS